MEKVLNPIIVEGGGGAFHKCAGQNCCELIRWNIGPSQKGGKYQIVDQANKEECSYCQFCGLSYLLSATNENINKNS